jgi:hypothetical protein
MTDDPGGKSPAPPVSGEKPPMDENLRPFIDRARQRHLRRTPNPGVLLEQAEGQNWKYGPHHRDMEAWQVQIFDAFGTRSASACRVFLDQLAELCMGDPDYGPNGWCPNEIQLNAALNIVSGVRPRNEVEAALAAQMVAVHFMTMTLSARVMRNPHGDPRTAAAAGKLARTYAMQCETMARLKGRAGKQKITVKYERHNHHHEHKHIHAEIGGGVPGFGDQPREPSECRSGRKLSDEVPAIENEGGPALPGPNAARDAMPMPSDQGPEAVPHPRRRSGVGRAQRRTQRGVQVRCLDP